MMLLMMKLNKIQFGTGIARPIMCLFLGLASLIIVSLIGHHQLKKLSDGSDYYGSGGRVALNPEQMDKTVRDILLNNFTRSIIVKYFNDITKIKTEKQLKIADFIGNTWVEQGLQGVHFAQYDDVLLIYPRNPSWIEIIDESGKVHQRIETRTEMSSNLHKNRTRNMFSPVHGLPVYVNLGTSADYDLLSKLGINVDGKIVIARYGIIKSTDKVIEAQKRGVVGIILYPEPTSYSHGTANDSTNFMFASNTDRASVGDPLTPLYPSLNYVVREYDEKYLVDHHFIPTIPVQHIGVRDAWQLLKTMDGPKVSELWQGSFNFSYRYGPGFHKRRQTVRMPKRTMSEKKSIRNIIGYIEGKDEPDRYIIVGHTYDDDGNGESDANSGTSVLLEMSRVFMTAINETGWQPRRTIVFCAWDGQEGSTEWIEQYKKLIEQRAVAYFNLNSMSGSESLWMESSPSLIKSVINSAKTIPNPRMTDIEKGQLTVYDNWIHSASAEYILFDKFPPVPSPGMSNDQTQFLSYIGVPVASFHYYNKSNPVKRTIMQSDIAIGQFWAHLTHSMVNSVLVPLNAADYAYLILNYIDNINAHFNESSLTNDDIFAQIHNLHLAAKRFINETIKFHAFALELKEFNAMIFERLNSRLTSLERCFISPKMNPNNWISRHVIYSYENINFPPEFNALYNEYEKLKKSKNTEEQILSLKTIKLLISDIQNSIECAIQLFKKLPL